MRGGTFKTLCVALLILMPVGVVGAKADSRGELESLDAALASLAARKNVAVLYDSQLVREFEVHVPNRDMPFDRALAQILRGTGLIATRTAAGAYTITRMPVSRPAAAIKEPAPDPLISDILVVGRATGDVDLQRSENDIQPYQILSQDRVVSSLAPSAGELLSEQVTMNLGAPEGLSSARQVSPDNIGTALPGSYVDLNGFGTDQSLVLVDGRRMPGVPGFQAFSQADVSAITPDAIDRMETLGLTAGAIFGVGATGGAVNLVLKHDYRGFDINIVNGLSQRGDDERHAIEAKAGFETADGRTKGMIRIGYSQSGGDTVGSRPVGTQRAALLQQLYPTETSQNLVGNAVFIQSATGGNLQLSPAYGGTSLGTTTTQLPVNMLATSQAAIALLKANAGQPITTLSPDGSGALQSLQPATRNLSIMTSFRQAAGDGVQLFVDTLFLRDTTRTAIPGTSNTTGYSAGDPNNPFDNVIYVSYPTPGIVDREVDVRATNRVTAGGIVRIGRSWSADVDFTYGVSILNSAVYDTSNSDNGVDILAGGNSLAVYLSQLQVAPSQYAHGVDRLYDGNIRIGGPLFSLPGGPATLTMTGEWREERNPGLSQTFLGGGETDESSDPPQRETVASGYAELRLPVFPADRGFALTRGLKLQLALRRDAYTVVIPGIEGLTNGSTYSEIDNHDAVTAFTVGSSVEPISGLMLRASYATGYEPPQPAQLIAQSAQILLSEFCDYARGGCASYDTGTFLYIQGGNPQAKAQRSGSLSLGFVLRPLAVPGLRVSLDYNRLLITHALTSFYDVYGVEDLLDNPAEYPGRVIRAPLTASDVAMGYTVGKLVEINSGLFNTGRTSSKTIEGAFDYRRRFAGGTGTVYARATWEPQYIQTNDPALGPRDLSGTFSGPLKLRAVGGLGWQIGPWAMALDGQYYGGYNTAFLDSYGDLTTSGAQNIPGKAYFDLALGYTAPPGWRGLVLRYRLAIRNLLDKQPFPIASEQYGLIADPYGDYVGRRAEFSVSTKF